MQMCPECFNENIKDGVCINCGFDADAYVWEDYQLPLFTEIGGKYIIGRAIGEGGFGITYTAFNKELKARYAVKEYYPADISGRGFSSEDGMTIYPFSGCNDNFSKGLERFRQEAEQLAGFDGTQGIVNVKDYVSENGTGYIFMEFVSGSSLEKYLSEKGGKLPLNEALEIIKPVMAALSLVHKKGIIHRDISPSNIILTKDTGAVLIDFGSSRQYADDRSMSVILKHGYAPYEQYTRHGEQDPSTDIYALCATVYRMISGEKPPDPIARIQEKVPLLKLTEVCDDISVEQQEALFRGLAVKREERTGSMTELYEQLYHGAVRLSNEKSHVKKAVVSVLALLALAGGGVLIGSAINDPAAEEVSVSASESVTVPPVSHTAAETASTVQTTIQEEVFEVHTIPVRSGIPENADSIFIKSGIENDLDTAEKNIVPDQSEMYTVKRVQRSMTTLGIMMVDVAYIPEESEITKDYTFLEYIYACNNNYAANQTEPLYSYAEYDFDHDGKNEYYIFAEIDYFKADKNFDGETAFLVYYAEDDGEVSFVGNGIHTYPSGDSETAFSDQKIKVIDYGDSVQLMAEFACRDPMYLIAEGSRFSVIEDSNVIPDEENKTLKGEKGVYIRNGVTYTLKEASQGDEQKE